MTHSIYDGRDICIAGMGIMMAGTISCLLTGHITYAILAMQAFIAFMVYYFANYEE